MIETKEKSINGATYAVTQMTARKALRMKARLMRLFGASLAQMFLPGSDKPMEGMAFSKDEAVKALQSLAMSLDDDVFEKLVVDLLSSARKDGIELNEHVIDLEFAGDLMTLLKVVWFVLEVNFASFFGESGIGNLFEQTKPLKTASMKRDSAKR
jgi:hypothetical protein